MMPRLPVNNPRCEVAMMSPVGVTRFCSGIDEPDCSAAIVIPGWCVAPDPESRDSGFDASHRPGMTALSRRAVADRRLERERGIPGKEDPGVLRHFGDEGVDQRTPHRLGVHRCEMRIRD